MRSVAFTLAFIAAIGQADAQVPLNPDHLARADANKDGLVTLAEFQTWRADQFDRLDRNGDGFITNADRSRRAAIRNPAFDVAEIAAAFDANRDGKVSRVEFANGPTPAFDRADANGDDVVTRDELQSARAARAGR